MPRHLPAPLPLVAAEKGDDPGVRPRLRKVHAAIICGRESRFPLPAARFPQSVVFCLEVTHLRCAVWTVEYYADGSGLV